MNKLAFLLVILVSSCLTIDENKTYLSVEEGLKNPTYVKRLNISNRNIESLSPKIQQFVNLKELYIWRTEISSLPDWIGDFDSLEVLDAHYAKLKSIPESIGKLKKLRLLNLRGNNLTKLPISLKELTSLKTICLIENMLPIEEINKLKVLDCHFCKIEANLKILPPSSNNFIDSFPYNIEGKWVQRLDPGSTVSYFFKRSGKFGFTANSDIAEIDNQLDMNGFWTKNQDTLIISYPSKMKERIIKKFIILNHTKDEILLSNLEIIKSFENLGEKPPYAYKGTKFKKSK